MWSSINQQLTSGRATSVAVHRNCAAVSYAEVVQRWQIDSEFRIFFNELLAAAPYSAFRWETPPITSATAERPFEFMLLDSPGLARTPDEHAFAEHFRAANGRLVIEFANLGRDAIMIVPCPLGPGVAYGHLAAFVRQAPAEQCDVLWQRVGGALARRLSEKPVWLSTAGAGVSWLHVRLDDRPKYYGHAPYRAFP
jgi:hypothetical protein